MSLAYLLTPKETSRPLVNQSFNTLDESCFIQSAPILAIRNESSTLVVLKTKVLSGSASSKNIGPFSESLPALLKQKLWGTAQQICFNLHDASTNYCSTLPQTSCTSFSTPTVNYCSGFLLLWEESSRGLGKTQNNTTNRLPSFAAIYPALSMTFLMLVPLLVHLIPFFLLLRHIMSLVLHSLLFISMFSSTESFLVAYKLAVISPS